MVPTCEYGADLQPDRPDCVVTAPVARRDFILEALLDGFGRWTKLTRQQVLEASNEPIILAGDKPNHYQAPHFVVAVKQRLDQMSATASRSRVGGYASPPPSTGTPSGSPRSTSWPAPSCPT